MNKYLVLSVMLGILVFASAGVFAETQTVNANVGGVVDLAITPSLIPFGSVTQGVASVFTNGINVQIGPISNQNINIDVTSVSNVFGGGNLKFAPIGQTVFLSLENFNEDFPCNSPEVGQPCNYNPSLKVFDLQLTIPIGTPAGTQTGTITYLVTGTPPI